MSNIPLVSISVVTYNHSNFIKQCLDGILMQKTNFPFEIILGEDESSDGTREICIEYANKYSNKINLFLRSRKDVIYINGNPTGRYNFIENLKASKSKYIALCEGDDYWTDPLKLQKQVDFLEANSNYSGCFHYTQAINENNELGRMFGEHSNKLDFNAEDTFSTLALFHTSSFVFLRSALAYPEWFSKIVSGDMALFSIIASKGKLRCLPEEMSIYRKHEGGITNTPNILNNYHSQRIELMKFLNEYHNFKYQKAADVVIQYHRLALGYNFNKIGIFDRVLKKIKKVING